MASNSRRTVVKELVIGFGFLNGLWIAIGFNPQNEVIKFLQFNLEGLSPVLKTFFIILPIILMIGTIITILKVYRSGGLIGIIALLTAFAAGTLVLKDWRISIALLAIAALIGLITFRTGR